MPNRLYVRITNKTTKSNQRRQHTRQKTKIPCNPWQTQMFKWFFVVTSLEFVHTLSFMGLCTKCTNASNCASEIYLLCWNAFWISVFFVLLFTFALCSGTATKACAKITTRSTEKCWTSRNFLFLQWKQKFKSSIMFFSFSLLEMRTNNSGDIVKHENGVNLAKPINNCAKKKLLWQIYQFFIFFMSVFLFLFIQYSSTAQICLQVYTFREIENHFYFRIR